MVIEKPVIKTHRFTGVAGESPFEFYLPVDYTYLVGFTFSAGDSTSFNIIQTGLVGIQNVMFDNQIILQQDTPIRIVQASEVCYTCKFFPVPLENLDARQITVKGSLVLSGAAEVVVTLLMTNKKPNFSISPEMIKMLQECQTTLEL